MTAIKSTVWFILIDNKIHYCCYDYFGPIVWPAIANTYKWAKSSSFCRFIYYIKGILVAQRSALYLCLKCLTNPKEAIYILRERKNRKEKLGKHQIRRQHVLGLMLMNNNYQENSGFIANKFWETENSLVEWYLDQSF